MPAFADNLSDEPVAEIVNYVRSHFDNRYADTIRSEDVARLRTSLSSANGSP
jgi:mono/diheme cytochrome c family protein